MSDEISKVIINSAGLPYYSLPHFITDSIDQEFNPDNGMRDGKGTAK